MVNDLSQCVHLYGFSPVWVRRCTVRFPLCEKDLLHLSHLWGFSPVWTRLWRSRWPLPGNSFLQMSQQSIAPECRRCVGREGAVVGASAGGVCLLVPTLSGSAWRDMAGFLVGVGG